MQVSSAITTGARQVPATPFSRQNAAVARVKPLRSAGRCSKRVQCSASRDGRGQKIVAQAAATLEAPAETSQELLMKAINTIRFLSIDAVNKANSGHPGLPMGCAPMAYVIYNEAMKHNPKDPDWVDRDRFVLSAGHGSMLQYSLMHLAGFESLGVRLLLI